MHSVWQEQTLTFGAALMQHGHYFAIMLPGSMVGLIVGFATQKYGKAPATVHS